MEGFFLSYISVPIAILTNKHWGPSNRITDIKANIHTENLLVYLGTTSFIHSPPSSHMVKGICDYK